MTRILTPGMVFDSDTLESVVSNYIACFDSSNLACVDPSTGEAFYFAGLTKQEIDRLISVLPIAELISDSLDKIAAVAMTKSLHAEIDQQFASVKPESCARLLSYLKYLGGEESLKLMNPFEQRELQGRMQLSSTTLRHLEIFSTYKGEGYGSLFYALDRCKTSVGSRVLRNRLQFPLTNQAQIEARLDLVQKWKDQSSMLARVRDVLAHVGDIERRLSKIALPTCSVRDLQSLSVSLRACKSAFEIAGVAFPETITVLVGRIEKTFVDEAPLSTRQGHIINKGIDPVLDELIVLSTDSQSLLSQMEVRERDRTGISSLKIRYNNVFGYYIEVTHTHKDKVPANYMRKQTLASAERFCTDELIELEKKVLSAQSRRSELEFEIFETVRRATIERSAELLSISTRIGELDLVTAFAWLAIENRYCRPQFSKNRIAIKASRHPVVEQAVKAAFVANDIALQKSGCLLLTGPNMAGKSTLMRQLALTSLMAQIGCFIPAQAAELLIFDQIFTRVGASDQLSEGLSTFMVEMKEAAEILANATGESLIVLDEIGRGTSTYDGMSLAQAILEYILIQKKSTTLFATHYHELTKMEEAHSSLKNAHMSVVEKNGEIRFLHTLNPGPAVKSYGIHVAKLAGIPLDVLERARELLKRNEGLSQKVQAPQLSLFDH